MTAEQILMCDDLKRCNLYGRPNQARFVGNMIWLAEHEPSKELTPGQATYLKLVHHKYRRQHGAPECAEPVKAVQ